MHLVDQSWQQFGEAVLLEIQITTEMQHMLYELTHRFYDRERNLSPKDPHSWKWDYRSARFSASYLSHTLHLLEGMILQLYEDTDEQSAQQAQQGEPGTGKSPAPLILNRAEPEHDQGKADGEPQPNTAQGSS